MLAITGLRTELTGKITDLATQMNTHFEQIDARFEKFEKSMELIAAQTAKTLDIVNGHEKRFQSIESPRA
jgi:hypothetical protein